MFHFTTTGVSSNSEITHVRFIKKNVYLIVLVAIAIAIKIFSLNRMAVETYYSDGIYPFISRFQRILFGWIPFSFGDILYAAAVIYLLLAAFRFIKSIVKRTLTRKMLLLKIKKLLIYALFIYTVFNLFWGLNYNRLGIGHQMNLRPGAYSAQELQQILNISISKLDQLSDSADKERRSLSKKRNLFDKAVEAYHITKNNHDFLEYRFPSVKPSIFSYLGNYLGYTGYYNPFTGEAQVNTTVPIFVQPFTSTHEVGHQLGYAKEMEANFVAFLTARNSPDPSIRYSLYFDLYLYAVRNLYLTDSLLARSYAQRLPELAKRDVRELRAFYKRYENPFEPVIRKLYGQYLKANEQPQGILSYDEVLAWIVAYYRRHGTL